MSSEHIELVKRLYEAFARGDLAAVARYCADDVEIVQSTALPWGGQYRGAAGLAAFAGNLTRHVKSVVTIDRYIDAGDHVAAIGWTRGHVVANGARFDVPLAHVWHVRDGRIARFGPFIDHPTMEAALRRV